MRVLWLLLGVAVGFVVVEANRTQGVSRGRARTADGWAEADNLFGRMVSGVEPSL